MLVIFGATGDLAKRKLIPALYDLVSVGCMNNFEVLGIGRTQMPEDDFRAMMRESAAKSKDARHFTPEVWAMFEKRHLSPDGLEMTWALNHVAPFLLTELLLDRLKASAPARVVTTYCR